MRQKPKGGSFGSNCDCNIGPQKKSSFDCDFFSNFFFRKKNVFFLWKNGLCYHAISIPLHPKNMLRCFFLVTPPTLLRPTGPLPPSPPAPVADRSPDPRGDTPCKGGTSSSHETPLIFVRATFVSGFWGADNLGCRNCPTFSCDCGRGGHGREHSPGADSIARLVSMELSTKGIKLGHRGWRCEREVGGHFWGDQESDQQPSPADHHATRSTTFTSPPAAPPTPPPSPPAHPSELQQQ